jgi:hypothetical protein
MSVSHDKRLSGDGGCFLSRYSSHHRQCSGCWIEAEGSIIEGSNVSIAKTRAKTRIADAGDDVYDLQSQYTQRREHQPPARSDRKKLRVVVAYTHFGQLSNQEKSCRVIAPSRRNKIQLGNEGTQAGAGDICTRSWR